MAKIRTFSRVFPHYHPNKGLSTFFIEKLNKSLGFEYGIPFGKETEEHFAAMGIKYSHQIYCACDPKHHTVREGHGVKPGDIFDPRAWTGSPYNRARDGSKPVSIAPIITVKKTWDFYLSKGLFKINDREYDGEHEHHHELLERIANNDGLTIGEFKDWFFGSPDFKKKKYFDGQIICWSDKIEY